MEDLKKLLAAATPGPWEVSERAKDWRPQVVSTEHGPICTMHIPEVGDADSNAALIVAAVNALPELLALREEVEVLRRLAPEHFRWTGGPDQTEDPEWACDKLKYGGAHFENIGTPEVRLVVYDDQDRRWVAERGDYIIKGETGLWVLPARAALNQEPKP